MPHNIDGYLGAQTGYVSNISGYKIPTTNIIFGGTFEKNGYFVNAEVGEGTSFYEKVDLGKKFDLGNNLGINTSISEQYTKSNSSSNYYKNTYYALDETSPDLGPSWKANDTRSYGQVALTYCNPTFEASLGVRGGIKSSTQPSLDGITLPDIGETRGTEYAGKAKKAFAEPVANIGVNLGKGWKAVLQASSSQGSLGISYNF